jgi:hypothetical protein
MASVTHHVFYVLDSIAADAKFGTLGEVVTMNPADGKVYSAVLEKVVPAAAVEDGE